mgnify:CR=1 FL=1
MASWRRVESGDTGRLVYADKSLPLVGTVLALFGLAGTVGTAEQLAVSLAHGPGESASLGSYALGVLVCLSLLALGLKMLVRREVVVDKAASEVTQTRSCLFCRRAVTTRLEGFTAVGWKQQWRDPDSDVLTAIYPV